MSSWHYIFQGYGYGNIDNIGFKHYYFDHRHALKCDIFALLFDIYFTHAKYSWIMNTENTQWQQQITLAT